MHTQNENVSFLIYFFFRQVLNKLKENKKILQATHNMYAYRIYNENTKYFLHDCDDDGEAQAGRRLMHLLEVNFIWYFEYIYLMTLY